MKTHRPLLFAACALAAVLGCKERGRPDPDVHMAISHERAIDATAAAGQMQGQGQPQGQGAGPGAGPGSDVPTRLEVPPEVQHAYTGIKVAWKDKSDGKEGVLEIPLGGGKPLPDPSFVVRADVYLPAFTMGGGAITSEGVAEQNPAARITVFEKGKEIFGGWIFTRFPDVHPFTHSRFQLHLEGGIPKAGK
jgi:hypothetical protein